MNGEPVIREDGLQLFLVLRAGSWNGQHKRPLAKRYVEVWATDIDDAKHRAFLAYGPLRHIKAAQAEAKKKAGKK